MEKQTAWLADIETRWSNVLSAAETSGHDARNRLLVRYHEAIQRYLRAKLVADPAGADALVSDFALRVLQLDPFLRRADPDRGRFRDYLAAVLYRMVQDHFRHQGRAASKRADLLANEPAVSADDSSPNDAEFLEIWKQELVNQAWRALEQTEKQSGKLFYSLVMYSQRHPDLTSQEIADQLGAERGEKLTAANVRQVIRRGRELFGELLVREVALSLEKDLTQKPAAAQVEEELIVLGLLNDYCKAALARLKE